jgi:GTPase
LFACDASPTFTYMPQTETRAGMVAIVGLPNAGKSSLLNRLLGTKLAIVTPAAQTTRERVVGIDTRDGVQMIFLDTPGIVEPSYLLHHSMVMVVRQAIADADVVVLLLDGTRPPPDLELEVLEDLRRFGERLLVVMNKDDAARDEGRQELGRWAQEQFDQETDRISAVSSEGVEALRMRIAAKLPLSPYLYPEDEISTQAVRFFVSELIRETVFEEYREEIPYSVAVRVEEFRENVEPIYIRATLFVERSTQKGILLGRGGLAMKELGRKARVKIEEFVEARVYSTSGSRSCPSGARVHSS